jgi:hypothetical protein
LIILADEAKDSLCLIELIVPIGDMNFECVPYATPSPTIYSSIIQQKVLLEEYLNVKL